MALIIAGRLENQDKAVELTEALQHAGIPKRKVSVFFVNPEGQHHMLPFGGDENHSPGTSEAGKGAWIGAGAGAVAGAAIGSTGGPIGSVIGAGVGAYTGSLTGAVTNTDDKPESDSDTAAEKGPVTDRKSGLHVAAEISREQKDKVAELVRDHGGKDVEEADGKIEDSHWLDFDPRQPIRLVS